MDDTPKLPVPICRRLVTNGSLRTDNTCANQVDFSGIGLMFVLPQTRVRIEFKTLEIACTQSKFQIMLRATSPILVAHSSICEMLSIYRGASYVYL